VPHDRLIHVYHFMKDPNQNQVLIDSSWIVLSKINMLAIYQCLSDTCKFPLTVVVRLNRLYPIENPKVHKKYYCVIVSVIYVGRCRIS
jgi:hypothetical protein